MATMKMRRYRDNWQSKTPVVKYRVVAIAEAESIQGIPGTQWLYSLERDYNSQVVYFIDGRTGHKAAKGIDIFPPGTNTNKGNKSPVVISLEPDEILIGTSGEYDDDKWDFVLFRVKLFYEAKDGNMVLDFYQTEVKLWQNVPPIPTATANSRFLVLRTGYSELPEERIRIYDINSSMSCGMQHIEDRTVAFLRDDWCLMNLTTSSNLYLVALHLPSLLASGKSIDGRELFDGIPTGIAYDVGSSVKLSTSINRLPNKSEYSVMLYTSSAQFTFDIRVEVVADSIYGEINFVGQPNQVIATRDLQDYIRRNKAKSSERYFPHSSKDPIQMLPSCQGPSVLMADYGTEHVISTLYAADYCQSLQLRHVEWRTSIRRYGKVDSEGTGSTSEIGLVQWIPYWDQSVGIMLLGEVWRPEPGVVHQICWF